MNEQHTKGVLRVSPDEQDGAAWLVGEDKKAVARVINSGLRGTYVADAERLATCWNAFIGILTEDIIDFVAAPRIAYGIDPMLGVGLHIPQSPVLGGRLAGRAHALAQEIVAALPEQAKRRTSYENVRDVLAVAARMNRLNTPTTEKAGDLSNEWVSVADVGDPKDEGLYLAIYRNGTSLPVALVSYGRYEFHSDDDPSADEEGMVKACGWHEETDDTSGEYSSLIWKRDVVAYQPANLAMEYLTGVRSKISSNGGAA